MRFFGEMRENTDIIRETECFKRDLYKCDYIRSIKIYNT